ncbi:MAG: hypothetical protein WC043_09475 [Pseudobdellovibrionaceae bacterium]
MQNKISSSMVLAFFFLSFCGFCAEAGAQTSDTSIPTGKNEHLGALPSSSEDIGMAFYYLGGETPDFDNLARHSKNFDSLDETARKDFLNREPLRMEQKFTALSPKTTPLVFRFPVPVKFVRSSDGTSTLSLILRQGSTDPFYFPIFYNQMPIAVLVQDIETFEKIHLDPKETAIATGKIDMQRTQTVFLEVYAIAADLKRSVVLDEMKQYPLLTQISYISLLNPSAEEIWSWESPLFKDKGANPIQTLHDLNSIK